MTLDPTTSLREPNAGPRVDSVENQPSEMRGPSSSEPRTEAERDNLLLLLGVSCIAACCLCWFLEHLAYLLRPLVFAVGLSSSSAPLWISRPTRASRGTSSACGTSARRGIPAR